MRPFLHHLPNSHRRTTAARSRHQNYGLRVGIAAERVWAVVAGRCVDAAPFWPLRITPQTALNAEDVALLRDAVVELGILAERDFGPGHASDIAAACLLSVPSYDDPPKFLQAVRGWRRDRGVLLAERWVDQAISRFDRVAEAWADLVATQSILWPDERPLELPFEDPHAMWVWVEAHQPSSRRVSLARLVLELTDADAGDLGRRALPLLDLGRECRHAAEWLLTYLAGFLPAGVTAVQAELLAGRHLHPGMFFRDGSGTVRDELFVLVNETTTRNAALVALAWLRDEKVIERFSEWRTEPPAFETDLFIPAHTYSRSAGWAVTAAGDVKDLYYDRAVELVPTATPIETSPVRTLAPADAACPWCTDPLTTLFDLDLHRPELEFLALPTGRLRIVTCERCTAYGEVHSDVDLAGNATWSSKNVKPPFVADGEWIRPATPFALGRTRRTPFETLALDGLAGGSQLGGHPAWVQDARYPTCHQCAEPMVFIGQIDFADVEEIGEGVLYAFIDVQCLTAATTYQQT